MKRGAVARQFASLLLAATLLAPACARRPADELASPARWRSHEFSTLRAGTRDTSSVRLVFLEFAAGLTAAARDSVQAWQWGALLQLAGADSAARDTADLARRFFAERGGDSLLLPFGPRWTLARRVEVEGDTLGVLSLAYRTYEFMGGVHPSEAADFAAFDRRTGCRLRFDALFRPGARDSLDRLIESLFRARTGLTPDERLPEAGYTWEDGRFHLNDNFALRPDGVRFHFNEYEIAPYAMGSTDLLVPFVMLTPFARADGPLGARRAR